MYKLKWFYDNGYTKESIDAIRAAVVNRFYTSYRIVSDSTNPPANPFDPEAATKNSTSNQGKVSYQSSQRQL